MQTSAVAQKRKATGGIGDDEILVEQEPAPTEAYEDDQCADNFDDDWEDINEENEDELGAVGGTSPPKQTRGKQPSCRKKKAAAVDDQGGLINKMAMSVTAMAGAYAQAKKSECPNAAWAYVLAENIDKLRIEAQEDKKIEIDTIVYQAVREQRRKDEAQ